MLTKFNKLIFQICQDVLQNGEYHFASDKDGNIFCNFIMQDMGKNVAVSAKQFNKKLSFVLTDDEGNSETLTQQGFQIKNNEVYKEFKKQLTEYKEKTPGNKDQELKDDIDASFNEKLDKEELDEFTKVKKQYTIDGTIFVFKLLKDISVENFVSCEFEVFNQKNNSVNGYRSLLSLNQNNSIILKIIELDNEGQVLRTMPSFMIQKELPSEIYDRLQKAIKKFEEFYNSHQNL